MTSKKSTPGSSVDQKVSTGKKVAQKTTIQQKRMNKDDFSSMVLVEYKKDTADNTLTKKQIGNILLSIKKCLLHNLNQDTQTIISRFASFIPVQKETRIAINPNTGKNTTIPAKISPKVKWHKTFKDLLVLPKSNKK